MTTYLGAFRLPIAGADHFSFGGILAIDRTTRQLHMATRTGRIVPLLSLELGTSALAQLPIANWTGGFTAAPSYPTGSAFAGVLVDDRQPVVTTASIYYDANNTQRVGHFHNGTWRTVFNERRQGFVAGYMCWVPEKWRLTLGDFITGQACIPIITRTSHGPAAFGVGRIDFDVVPEPVYARQLLYYDHEHQTLGDYQTARIAGCAIIGDELIFAGSMGVGGMCYGIGTRDRSLHNQIINGERYCYDLEFADKGAHAEDGYECKLWRYPIPALLSAVNPWDVVPTIETLPEFLSGPTRLIGVAADGDTLYLSQYAAENNTRVAAYPVVHAFQVAPLTPPVPIPEPEPPLVVIPTLEERVAALEQWKQTIGAVSR
jgi:hypothetical protein